MKLVRCPNCGFVCKRNGKTNAGSQRWYCNQCDLQHIRNNIAIFHKNSPKDISSLGLLFKLQLLLICPLTCRRIYLYLHLLQVM